MNGALIIKGLSVARGAQQILHGVDLEIAPGKICALMGASGAGKSTALRAIVALQPFQAGTVRLGDFTLAAGLTPPESKLRGFRRQIGMVFQEHALFEHLTARENIMLALIHALGWSRTKAAQTAATLLESLGVATRGDAYPRQLSGGEAQRVAIARALAPAPMMLMLDEPTAALDPSRRGALGETLRALAKGGRGLLLATHDMDFARVYADQIVMLVDGRIASATVANQQPDRS